jgi:hypothetical protein
VDRRLLCLWVGLMGCATPPTPGPAAAVPPRSPADACAVMRDYFARRGHFSVSPQDMTAGCHMRITAEAWRSDDFARYLGHAGFQPDPGHRGDPIFPSSSWLTPTTRCTLVEIPNHDEHGRRARPVDNLLGEATVDYKIDCEPD